MKKALTIEDLKERIGKPVFVVCLLYNCKEWRILKNIGFGGVNTLEFTDDGVIEEELQGKFRFFDEEVTQQEIKEILEEEEKKKKKTGYERVPKEQYYSVSSGLESINHHDGAFNFDNETYSIANYFNDETLGENIARAERLRYQLRRFAALNGGITSIEDWVSRLDWKYLIAYDYNEQKMYVNSISKFKNFGQIYFKDEKACKKAIEIFKDELLWYFTEFKEMLY